jgi:SSS family solute:Na+ symporter
MFWRRATGHGAFSGLVAGTAAAAAHHGLSLPSGSLRGIKGGWLAPLLTYPSEMAQNFWTAIAAFTACLGITVLVSLVTKRERTDAELAGLVYSLTERKGDADVPWFERPVVLGVAVLVVAAALNVFFW